MFNVFKPRCSLHGLYEPLGSGKHVIKNEDDYESFHLHATFKIGGNDIEKLMNYGSPAAGRTERKSTDLWESVAQGQSFSVILRNPRERNGGGT